MRRTDDNFAAWNDFKAWMDTSFADALRFGTDAIHRADPKALSAMEGVQIPGWGGFDYTKLVHAVDVMEAGDYEESLSIIRSINPAIIPLTTSFAATRLICIASGARCCAARTAWCCGTRITVSCVPTPLPVRARRPMLRCSRRCEDRSAAVSSNAQPVYDAVAILYSPVSFRVRWMLDHRSAGDAWMQRSSENELEDNAWRAALRNYAAALARMGLRPRYITPEAPLALRRSAGERLILPHTPSLCRIRSLTRSPLSPRRAAGNRRHAAGTVRRTWTPASSAVRFRRQLFHQAISRRVLTLAPAFHVEAPNHDVDTYVYRSHGQRLLALQRRTPSETAEDRNG